jgi:hypothetical protein
VLTPTLTPEPDAPLDADAPGFTAVLDRLSYRERRIVAMRCGFVGFRTHSPAEVGRMFNITPERAEGIAVNALNQLVAFHEAAIRYEAACKARLLARRRRHGVRTAGPTEAGETRTCARARESRRDAPGRFRGSRRSGGGSRAGPDDEGESDRPPGLTLGRQGHDNLTLAGGWR